MGDFTLSGGNFIHEMIDMLSTSFAELQKVYTCKRFHANSKIAPIFLQSFSLRTAQDLICVFSQEFSFISFLHYPYAKYSTT